MKHGTKDLQKKISIKFDDHGQIEQVAGLLHSKYQRDKALDYNIQLDMIKNKYSKQQKKMRQTNHKRRASQLSKLDQIIKDAADLYQILENTNDWVQKHQSPTHNPESPNKIDDLSTDEQILKNLLRESKN